VNGQGLLRGTSRIAGSVVNPPPPTHRSTCYVVPNTAAGLHQNAASEEAIQHGLANTRGTRSRVSSVSTPVGSRDLVRETAAGRNVITYGYWFISTSELYNGNYRGIAP